MRKKKTLEEEINEFFEVWDFEQMACFLRDIIPLFELYDVDQEDDWVEKAIGGDAENFHTVRLIRTAYLISKMASFHSRKISTININFNGLWERMEKCGIGKFE